MQTFPKPLTPEEERACLKRLREGDREARNILIERNLRLVAHVVKKYQITDYETERSSVSGDDRSDQGGEYVSSGAGFETGDILGKVH